MKKTLTLTVGLAMCIALNVSSQSLKLNIERISGGEKSLTLKFKPGSNLKIGSTYTDSEALKAINYYSGSFLAGSQDSITIKVNKFSSELEYSDGRQITTNMPATSFSAMYNAGSDEKRIAIANIRYIYTEQKSKAWGVGLPLIILSLVALPVSPVICYNYKDGTFNNNLFKNIALGCAAGIATGVTIGFMTPPEHYHFSDGRPGQTGKIWQIKSIKSLNP